MKKIKLLLAAFAAMVSLSVNAQLTDGTVYWIQDVGTGQFISQGANWGTQATVQEVGGLGFQVVYVSDGVYKLKNIMWNTVNSADLGLRTSDRFCDQAAGDVTLVASGDGYKLNTSNGGYLCNNGDTNGDGVKRLGSTNDAAAATVWKFLTKAQYDAAIQTYKDGKATTYATNLGLSATSVSALESILDENYRPKDYTSSINNPTLGSNWDGWAHAAASGSNRAEGAGIGSGCAEFWDGCGAANQTVSGLPNGLYKVEFVGTFRPKGNTDSEKLSSDQTSSPAFVYANDAQVEFLHWIDVPAKANGRSGITVANGYNNSLYTYVTDGTLKIGIVQGCWENGKMWCPFGQFRLTYYTDQVTDEEIAALVASIPASGTVPTAVTTNLTSLKTTLESTKTIPAFKELSNAITAANVMATNYARYNSVKTAALAIATSLDTSATDTELNNATTNDAINTAIANLRAAFLAELPNVEIPVDPGYIDVTAVMVDNASVRQNTNYWTAEEIPGGVRTGNSWAVCNFEECEFYQQNFKFYQTLALTPGTWEFGVTGFHRAGNHSTYFYAGVDRILIPGVESSVVNNMAEAKNYFDSGEGKVALKFLIEAAGNVEIGIDNQDEATDRWTIFRDFTLKYYGAPDYSVYEDQWTALVGDANTAKTAHANVTGTELTALNEAIADSPAGSNLKATYTAKITALQNALSAFNTAAPSYDAYVAYRAETVSLFGEDLANTAVATAPTSAAEAQTAIQTLNIAQYNKVASDYPHSLTSKIGDFSSWTGTAEVGTPREAGTPNSLDWEHWSGVTHPYYEQDGNGYNNAGGWTIKYTKTTTLPAGSYVVKVAARSSAGVTSSVSVKDDKDASLAPIISLPCKGNRARGIAKDGKASWSDSDEFILENQGGGWEWRFVPFTLAAETEVTMTFYAEASSRYQWMSIGDGELLSATNIATAVAYNETANNTIEDEDVANVTITRTIKASYNTVVLPFECTLGQVEAAFGTGTEVYAFSENSADENDITVNFNKVSAGTISANVPVLIKATTDSNEQVFNGVQVVAPTADVKVAGTNIDFVGTYAPIAAIAEGDYFIGNGAIYKSAGNTSMKAFRAYLKVKNANADVKLFLDGIETGIDEINGTAVENGAIYNLAGQRVNKAQKGVFIVNGKKVIVK